MTIAKDTRVTTVRSALEKMMPQFAMVLPKHITPERMLRVTMTCVQQNPKLLECDRDSLYSAVMRSAQLGLEPDGILGQAYLIPFKGKVQLIAGYKGLIDLARRSGEVLSIIAKEVCRGDEFCISWHEEIPFRHIQPVDGERGDVLGFWALARFKDGGFHWDYMSIQEVLKVRDKSAGWQSAVQYKKTAESPWTQHFEEMGKKTVIRRIAKYLPMSVQRLAAAEDMVDSSKSFTVDQFGDIIPEKEDAARDAAKAAKDALDVTNQPEEKPVEKSKSKLDVFSAAANINSETGEVLSPPKAEEPIVRRPVVENTVSTKKAPQEPKDTMVDDIIGDIWACKTKAELNKLLKELNNLILDMPQPKQDEIQYNAMNKYEELEGFGKSDPLEDGDQGVLFT